MPGDTWDARRFWGPMGWLDRAGATQGTGTARWGRRGNVPWEWSHLCDCVTGNVAHSAVAPRQSGVVRQPRSCLCPSHGGPRCLSSTPPKARCLQSVSFISYSNNSLTFPAAFDDGRSHLLLCLHGLLPITYRRAQYNIPVALWITRDYPVHPPIVYVVPSPDLLVKPGPTVDPSGRCNLEYIQNWQRKCEVLSPNSCLSSLMSSAGMQSC